MLPTLQVITLLLTAVCMALPLAHALELPGKLRLPRATYIAVQPIYYPGFTIGASLGEFGGIVATIALLAATPGGTMPYWLTFAALAALLVMHGLYWALTHPVNKFWLEGQDVKGAGAAFFAFARDRGPDASDWKRLRDRWEYSHVARTAMAMLAFILVAAATALG
jgi:hypothetical protein